MPGWEWQGPTRLRAYWVTSGAVEGPRYRRDGFQVGRGDDQGLPAPSGIVRSGEPEYRPTPGRKVSRINLEQLLSRINLVNPGAVALVGTWIPPNAVASLHLLTGIRPFAMDASILHALVEIFLHLIEGFTDVQVTDLGHGIAPRKGWVSSV